MTHISISSCDVRLRIVRIIRTYNIIIIIIVDLLQEFSPTGVGYRK